MLITWIDVICLKTPAYDCWDLNSDGNASDLVSQFSVGTAAIPGIYNKTIQPLLVISFSCTVSQITLHAGGHYQGDAHDV